MNKLRHSTIDSFIAAEGHNLLHNDLLSINWKKVSSYLQANYITHSIHQQMINVGSDRLVDLIIQQHNWLLI
jgi:hypothetical protein